jgi:hypothetical protein
MNATLPPSTTFQALRHFVEEHSSATRLLRVAAQDYAAARCLLLNHLFAGHVLGAQAIEKFLKSYLLLNNPQRGMKKLSHSLPKLLEEVKVLFPQLPLSGFTPLAEKFTSNYPTRYPDNVEGAEFMTTSHLLDLDALIIFLNENMPCPRYVKYRAGIYPFITFSLGYQATVPPEELWIKQNNQALAPLLPRINADYVAVMKELYP